MTNSSFWNNFNKPSRKTKYQSRLQILLWDGPQLEKSFHTKEYQTHSCTGRVKFTQFKLSRWNTLSSYYITFVSRLLSILKEKEQKSVHVHYNIPECQLHALKRKKRKKNNEVDFWWAKGGLQIVKGREFTSVRVSYHV